jgi:alpha-amylase/alpha-mannosidase (GH57 family)
MSPDHSLQPVETVPVASAPRYVCLHGHFYQPPREHPWLGEIERQESAFPYHDWNERIAAECYAPNAAARIVDARGHIHLIVNNYSRMSFNFGPTLMSWLEAKRPDVYEQILKADVEGRERFGGHGPAIAQAYNHIIMPLANRRDKLTQIRWGMKDFQHRFGREPEGMWLPETAVDLETLQLMVDHGVKFTILAPRQGSRVRRIEEEPWHDVSNARVDPRRAYRCALPSGDFITLFFYDGIVAQDCAFGGLLSNGEDFVQRLLSIFDRHWKAGQLVHVATDGETYGHHVRLADMTLAYALRRLEQDKDVRLTVYGEFLELHPPDYEVEIYENSSWSDIHGIERWRSGKGSCTGMHPGWQQEWRGPLREGLDHLRDGLADVFACESRELFRDPWAARDDYIRLILDRSPSNVDAFFDRHAPSRLRDGERIRALHLLEMQRNGMLMFTSCGWFFDEISGIETVQILQYANGALQIAEALSGRHLESDFIEHLRRAPSNIPEFGHGATVYDRFVKAARVDILRVAVHYAVTTVFHHYPERSRLFCFDVHSLAHQPYTMGRQTLVIGRAELRSRVSTEETQIVYAVLHLGDHNIMAGVRPFVSLDAFRSMQQSVTEAFFATDLPQAIRLIDRHFSDGLYSIRHLFRDEQERVLERVLEPSLSEMERAFRQIYTHHQPLMNIYREARVPPPKVFATTVEFLVNAGLRRCLNSPHPLLDELSSHVDEAQRWRPQLDVEEIRLAAKRRTHALLKELASAPEKLELLDYLNRFLHIVRKLPIAIDLWEAQNIYFVLHQVLLPQVTQRQDNLSQTWIETFRSIGEALQIRRADD